MNRPTTECCQRTYRLIQACCAKRMSMRIGQQVRALAGGAKGDITALTPAALQTVFTGADYTEALRLLELAIYIKKKYSHAGKRDAYTEE